MGENISERERHDVDMGYALIGEIKVCVLTWSMDAVK